MDSLQLVEQVHHTFNTLKTEGKDIRYLLSGWQGQVIETHLMNMYFSYNQYAEESSTYSLYQIIKSITGIRFSFDSAEDFRTGTTSGGYYQPGFSLIRNEEEVYGVFIPGGDKVEFKTDREIITFIFGKKIYTATDFLAGLNFIYRYFQWTPPEVPMTTTPTNPTEEKK